MLSASFRALKSSLQGFQRRKLCSHIDVSNEVQTAINEERPIVALESTIITHGMPHPANVQCAVEVEELVRENGAIPATIAILNGRIKVGLTHDDLIALASMQQEVIKCSRRDLPYVVANKKTGGTTVCGTMIIAHKMGLKVFATGGIGGVHREGHNTLDISADLIELGRTPVAVVCSGVKSILDIPRTLEFLETQGVCVATYGEANGNFPDFYTRDSGCKVPYNVAGPSEAAKLIKTLCELDLKAGILFAVPIPEAYALKKEQITAAIEAAYVEAANQGIRGKEVTPFLLAAIVKLTQGTSLEANMALIKNNASVAAKIAIELYGFKKNNITPKLTLNKRRRKRKLAPTVIGASIFDLSFTLPHEFPQSLVGATHPAQVKQSPGGVGRNLAEGIFKLYGAVNFLSAIGDDEIGNSLLHLMPSDVSENIAVIKNESTSLCSLIFDNLGDCKLILGNMDIHQRITPDIILRNEELLSNAPLIVMDSNLSVKTMECVLNLAERKKLPVFFEPTDMLIAGKPFSLPPHLTRAIKMISPNLHELEKIAEIITGKPTKAKLNINAKTPLLLEEAKRVLKSIESFFDCIILTLGHHGVILSVNSKWEKQPLFDVETGNYLVKHDSLPQKHSMTFYEATPVENITNVSGAGDSFSSGFIAGLLRGLPLEKCVELGFMAAERALQSLSAVPQTYFDDADNFKAFEVAQPKLKVFKIQ